jgi:hypothetical protein
MAKRMSDRYFGSLGATPAHRRQTGLAPQRPSKPCDKNSRLAPAATIADLSTIDDGVEARLERLAATPDVTARREARQKGQRTRQPRRQKSC